jgi:predicted phage tail protein
MKHVQLHGELAGRFGSYWALDVLTPAEAVTAIDANRPGFTHFLVESEKQGMTYQIMLGEDHIPPDALCHPFGAETFHIVPVIGGANQSGDATGKIIVGAVIAIATIGYGLAAYGGGMGAMSTVVSEGAAGAALSETAFLGMSYGTVAMMGASIAFAGISTLLAKTPQAAAAQKDGSFAFSGPVNNAAQGGPIPIGYGMVLVGSTVVSAGIRVTNEAVI